VPPCIRDLAVSSTVPANRLLSNAGGKRPGALVEGSGDVASDCRTLAQNDIMYIIGVRRIVARAL